MTMKNMFSQILSFVTSSRRGQRWTKAAEAKNLIKHILLQLERDKTAFEKAIKRLESSVKDQTNEEDATLLARDLYEHLCANCALALIQNFCKCVLDNLPLLVEERSFAALPSHVQEAVASLVFASRRCQSVRMKVLREFFRERYAPNGGKEEEAMDCKVHTRLRNEYLCEERLSDEVKEWLAKAVASRFEMLRKFSGEK